MNYDKTTAENWLIATVGTLFVIAGLSFAYDAMQRYMGITTAYAQPVGSTQIQLGSDEVDKSLYVSHVMTAGQEACGCPYCCSV